LGLSKFVVRHAIAAALLFAPLGAHASEIRPITNITKDVISFLGFGPGQAENPTDPAPIPQKQPLAPRAILPSAASVDAPGLPAVVAATAAPSVETPLRRLFCVEYARMRSGLAVFGDARHWWDRAKNLYARASHPVEEAVMVFSGSKRLKRGHVAVVTDIVSPREIIVDQANWQNRGEIDHATPVLDVSKNNDWSLVRVWDIPSRGFGTRIYPISGFIAKDLTRQALNN
jgi:surface antigen